MIRSYMKGLSMGRWYEKPWEIISEPLQNGDTGETLDTRTEAIKYDKHKPHRTPVKRRLKAGYKKLASWITILTACGGLIGGAFQLNNWIETASDRHKTKLEMIRKEAAKDTLNRLYYSWENKNLQQYKDCWDPSCVQISDIYTRNYQQIIAKRAADFQKYKRVIVKYFKIESSEVSKENLIEVYTMYSIHFEPKDNQINPFNETDVRERFYLQYNENTKQAKIVRNDTYLNQDVSQLKEKMAPSTLVPEINKGKVSTKPPEMLMMETPVEKGSPPKEVGPTMPNKWEALPSPKK